MKIASRSILRAWTENRTHYPLRLCPDLLMESGRDDESNCHFYFETIDHDD